MFDLFKRTAAAVRAPLGQDADPLCSVKQHGALALGEHLTTLLARDPPATYHECKDYAVEYAAAKARLLSALPGWVGNVGKGDHFS